MKRDSRGNVIQPITSILSKTLPSPSPSSSASAAVEDRLTGEYEVFLSFRGEDTRKGFTDFLYTYLVGAGIRTFKDDNKLRIGEEIGPDLLKAIKESKISIPIFSKNYAYSKWCLRELEQMVECQANEGQKIFPIFYDVDASDVRNQRGSYEKAFWQHKKNFDEKTVQRWKKALTNVGQLKGYELVKETNGLEGELAKKVSGEVWLHLKKNYTHEPINLVGMDRHLDEMKGLLDVDSNGVRVVGIHGMGGIGKTTIAKAIYNHLCEHFECCCFLEDVREKAKKHHNGLIDLQNLLASKILKTEFPKIDDVDDGINRIKAAVRGKKVLIVLDDIDAKPQFEKLAGECDWFGKGSRIIVTTRNKEVLNALEFTYKRKGLLEVYRSYEPELMDPAHSLKLFSKYAFMSDSPPEDYVILSKEVVSSATGLPLVLVTLGSLLFGNEDKVLWQEKLRELAKIPHEEVLEKLRISYEALNDQQKHIFLDIACIFVGEDKTNPCYMWDDCEFYPRNGINALVLRSLVKIGDDNTLRMHDQLRDLGRQIVRTESTNEPGERSRLWRHEEGLDVLERHMGTKNVEALCLDIETEENCDELSFRCFKGQDFRQLPNLRFLRLGYANLDGDFKHLLSKLRWLEWSCCGMSVPSNFHLKNLIVLDLSRSEMEDDWEGWSELKMATKLKVLNLSHCLCLKRAPNLPTFPNLETLNLSYGKYWKEIDPSIQNLTSLRVLDLSNCYCIIKLDCCMFVALESLNLHNCGKLRRIDGIEMLESLRYLDLSYCQSLEKLPDFSNLKKLKTLKITACNKVSEIQGLNKLESLELLEMSFCHSVERLPGLRNLGMLKELNLYDCDKLLDVEGLAMLELLESLNLSNCTSLKEIPDLSNLRHLKKLRMLGLDSRT